MSQLEHEQIELACEELKLHGIANQYLELAQDAADRDVSYTQKV